MSIDVNEAVTAWNNECAAAKTDLATLEAALKADYNKYIDSLSAYLQRLKAANDVREGYVNDFGADDIKNNTHTRNNFIYSAAAPIENNATEYILDNSVGLGLRNSYELVRSTSTDRLLAKKVV